MSRSRSRQSDSMRKSTSGGVLGSAEASVIDPVENGLPTSDFENPTGGFTLVNAALTWRPWGADNPTSLILSANNIFDVEARRHASFTKDFVPLAGRDLRVSARISF